MRLIKREPNIIAKAISTTIVQEEINMFTADMFIDTVQNSKKFFVNTFITDKEMNKTLNSLVDKQTEFTKEVVKANEKLVACMTKPFQAQ